MRRSRQGSGFRAPCTGIGETLVEAVEPYDFPPDLGGLGKQRGIRSHRETQAGLDKVGSKPGRIGGMRRDGREIRHQVGPADRGAHGVEQFPQQTGLDVRNSALTVGPEGKDAASASVVVMQVRYRRTECHCRPRYRRMIVQRRHIDLPARMVPPESGIRPILAVADNHAYTVFPDWNIPMVATVADVGSASSTVHYFEQDGYYAKGDPEHRKASFWHGEAARALGLGRHVSPKRFNAVLESHVPGTDTIAVAVNDQGRREVLGMAIGAPRPRPSGPPSCAPWPAAACAASSW